MKGAPFARSLNPTLKKSYSEFEFDVMFPMERVIDNKVINDLEHAKGFCGWSKMKMRLKLIWKMEEPSMIILLNMVKMILSISTRMRLKKSLVKTVLPNLTYDNKRTDVMDTAPDP